MCLSLKINRPADVLSEGEHKGIQWVTMHNTSGYRCGYVRVPAGHPWHGHGREDSRADVHGGITFAEPDVPCDAPGEDNAWWLGFDCAHSGDAPDPSLPMSISSMRFIFRIPGEIRTQEYVEEQCRDLAEQVVAAAA
jgi:hypothetical protein